jgi:hypothetical protein
MRPALAAVADRQGGPFTRRDAVAAGYSDREIKTLTGRRGGWATLRRGVYVDRAGVALEDPGVRYEMAIRAVGLVSLPGGVFSHGSAAELSGLAMRPRWRDWVDLTRPDVHGGRSESGTRHHRAFLLPEDILEQPAQPQPLRWTGPARTAVDIARCSGFEDGVVAADSALRSGCGRSALEAVVARMRCWPGIAAARAAVDFADGGAQNPAESLLRILVGELGIGPIQTQYLVSEGGRDAWVDVRVRRHLFEFDGRVKYRLRGEGGVADRPLDEVVWEEKIREDFLRRAHGGYGLSRVVWEDLLGERRRRTKLRLRREYEQTCRRFGTE